MVSLRLTDLNMSLWWFILTYIWTDRCIWFNERSFQHGWPRQTSAIIFLSLKIKWQISSFKKWYPYENVNLFSFLKQARVFNLPVLHLIYLYFLQTTFSCLPFLRLNFVHVFTSQLQCPILFWSEHQRLTEMILTGVSPDEIISNIFTKISNSVHSESTLPYNE